MVRSRHNSGHRRFISVEMAVRTVFQIGEVGILDLQIEDIVVVVN